jgi:hypothetical protein
MDLNKLTLSQLRMVSKLVDLLGIPEDTENCREACDMLDALTESYRRQFAHIRELNRSHGD